MSQERPIQLLKTAFVEYHHADLAKAKRFLLDFGMSVVDGHSSTDTIYFHGYGTEPFVYVAHQSTTEESFFGGAAYVVDSRTELDRAAALSCSTGPVRKLEGPAGGEIVTLTDPVGYRVHLIHGWQEKAKKPVQLQKLVVNFEDEKPRKGAFQRFEPGPAPVFRWGHYGVTYPEGRYQDMYDWYTQTISLAPSDVVLKGETPVTCFFHVDRGEEYSDHHAFFFKMVKPGQELNVAHAAFEVHDFDVQQLGHQHLAAQGYELCWGVGRVRTALLVSRIDLSLTMSQHVLGSQVVSSTMVLAMSTLHRSSAQGRLVPVIFYQLLSSGTPNICSSVVVPSDNRKCNGG